MNKPEHRGLTAKEKRVIRKLATTQCVSYDHEYGCLPLDGTCYMFTPLLSAACASISEMLCCHLAPDWKPCSLTSCSSPANAAAETSRSMGGKPIAPQPAPKSPERKRPLHGCENTAGNRDSFKLWKLSLTRGIPGPFYCALCAEREGT